MGAPLSVARPWLQHYDYWVPPHLAYPGRPLYEILDTAAVDAPTQPATVFLGATLTYEALKHLSDRFATALGQLGIGAGDRVAIMLPNCPQYVLAVFAVLRHGAIVVNINPSYTARELALVLADATPRVLLTLDALAPLAAAARESLARGGRLPPSPRLPEDHHRFSDGGQPAGRGPAAGRRDEQSELEHVIVTSLAEFSAAAAAPPQVEGALSFSDLIAGVEHPAVIRAQIHPDSIAVLQYTGGTTGTPKAAMLSHGNIFANVVQTEAFMYRQRSRGDARYVLVLPLFHIYAFTVGMMKGVWVGAVLVLIPKYDVQQVLTAIRDHRPTYFPGVPTIFVSLLTHPDAHAYGLDRVRTFNTGGAPCPLDVIHRWEQAFGRCLHEGYGLSETSPVTHTTPQLSLRKPGTIGVPLSDTWIKIVDLETGARELPAGEPGELCVSGPQVMRGYWQRPDESAAVLRSDADGRIWFHTGDIARIDEDGYTTIVQRKKDMIIVDGFNVYPSEVEAILYAHPAVRLAAVIGVADAYHGEVVRAYVALQPGASVAEDDLVAHCAGDLAPYKVPRSVELRDTLPMSAVGKILYRVLRDEVAAAASPSSSAAPPSPRV
jgi:long-chain acyl-CoA synthetase